MKTQLQLIHDIQVVSPDEFATSQQIEVDLNTDIRTIASLKVAWILFASDIAPHFKNSSCDQISAFNNSYITNTFDASIARYGINDLEVTDSTSDIPQIVNNFTGLRSNTNYNFTLCLRDEELADTIDWSHSSTTFVTRENGFSIAKVKIDLDSFLAEDEIVFFICKLNMFLEISNTTIASSKGEFCPSSRLLQSTEPSLKKERSLEVSRNYLSCLIYGNPNSETTDTSVSSILISLTETTFYQNFFYQNSTGSIIHVTKVSHNGDVDIIAPVFSTLSISLQTLNDQLIISNVSLSGPAQGYLHLYLIPESNVTNNAKMTEITNRLPQLAPNDGLYTKRSFFVDDVTAYTINGIDNATSYLLFMIATNDDPGEFALRTQTTFFYVPATSSLNITTGTGLFIGIEVGALVVLLFIWIGLFRGDLVSRCFGKKKQQQSKLWQTALPDNPKGHLMSINSDNLQKTSKDERIKASIMTSLNLHGNLASAETMKSHETETEQLTPRSMMEEPPASHRINISPFLTARGCLDFKGDGVLDSEPGLGMIPNMQEKLEKMTMSQKSEQVFGKDTQQPLDVEGSLKQSECLQNGTPTNFNHPLIKLFRNSEVSISNAGGDREGSIHAESVVIDQNIEI